MSVDGGCGHGTGADAKTVFVNRYFFPDQSASSQMLTDLACGLADSGLSIHVVCSSQRYDDPDCRLRAREVVHGVVVHRVWTSRFGRDRLWGRALDYATFYCSSALVLLRLLRPGDTVVAKTDPPLISVIAFIAAFCRRARLVNWLQDIFPEVATVLGALPRWASRPMLHCRNASLRAARANVVLGERMRDHLLGCGIDAVKIAIVQNWSEPHHAAAIPPSSSLLRQRLGLGNRFVVGYSGNLGRAHEFDTVLEAADLLKGDERFAFLMIGAGNGMKKLAERAARRGLPNFTFLPYQPRDSIADSLAAADAHWVSLRPPLEGLIVPSKYYGIIAAARPVVFIGDRDGELGRDIRRNRCGAVVGVGDAAGLVQVLREWHDDAALCAKMGDAARRHYQQDYGAQRAVERWHTLLRRGEAFA